MAKHAADAAPALTTAPHIDAETKLLAAMAYGEASAKDDADEIYALASVLKRQSNIRGYSNVKDFAAKEKSFSFVTNDGNPRYGKLMKATDAAIQTDKGMALAVDAAKNALANGLDKSGGAWFWDGADIKSNYAHHPKVKSGIIFTDPAHNIYGIKPSTKLVVSYKYTKSKVKNQVFTSKTELWRYDHVYESTEAHGGTIFWKFNPDYVTFTRAKEFK